MTKIDTKVGCILCTAAAYTRVITVNKKKVVICSPVENTEGTGDVTPPGVVPESWRLGVDISRESGVGRVGVVLPTRRVVEEGPGWNIEGVVVDTEIKT